MNKVVQAHGKERKQLANFKGDLKMRINKTAKVKAPGGKHKMRGSGKAPQLERGFNPKDRKMGARAKRLEGKEM